MVCAVISLLAKLNLIQLRLEDQAPSARFGQGLIGDSSEVA
jgi:hypothetical protein